jgi:hypothetical protein
MGAVEDRLRGIRNMTAFTSQLEQGSKGFDDPHVLAEYQLRVASFEAIVEPLLIVEEQRLAGLQEEANSKLDLFQFNQGVQSARDSLGESRTQSWIQVGLLVLTLCGTVIALFTAVGEGRARRKSERELIEMIRLYRPLLEDSSPPSHNIALAESTENKAPLALTSDDPP